MHWKRRPLTGYFFLDADERITPGLAKEIKDAVTDGRHYAYQVPRLNHLMGQPIRHGGWYPDYVLRLFPRGHVRVEGVVHPRMVHDLSVRTLKNDIVHYTYPSWEHYFNKLNLYTTLAAEKNAQKGVKVSFIRDIILRPIFAFFKMYVLRSGWRDGKAGFVLAAFHYTYTMAKYTKLYWRQRGA